MAKQYDITIDQGAQLKMTVTYKSASGASLIGALDTVAMQIRATKSQTGAMILDCEPYLTISTIAIILILPHEITAGLTAQTGYYDMKLTQSGAVRRILQGAYTLDTGVTHE